MLLSLPLNRVGEYVVWLDSVVALVEGRRAECRALESALAIVRQTHGYIQEMAKRGCHGYASFYLNAAQGESELKQTADAAREAFTIIRDAMASGTVEQRLECLVQQDAFRRLVR